MKRVLENFKAFRGVDEVLDHAYEHQDWQAARERFEAIVNGDMGMSVDRRMTILRRSAGIYLKTLQGL
ncbi:hypothetical protein D9M68_920450 [compost metagenome]